MPQHNPAVVAFFRVMRNLHAQYPADAATVEAYCNLLQNSIEQQAAALAASEARVDDLTYRLATANAFGEQCMTDINALLQRAESAEQSLAAMQARVDGLENLLARAVSSFNELAAAYEAAIAAQRQEKE